MKWIETEAELTAAATELAGAGEFFIDTEFESNRRGTTLCLLQLVATDETYLIDALALPDLRQLAPVIGREDVTWVLHAGMHDVTLLLEAMRLPRPPRLFDTQIAWALQGAEANVSLAYLLYRVLGLRTMKSHQTDDWQRRPLPASQLKYAADDVAHLPRLAQQLRQRLSELGRLDCVHEVCMESLWPKPEKAPPLTLDSFRHAWQLQPPHQAALRFLMNWYNALPEWERQRAPALKTLTALASRLPRTPKDLSRIKGLPPHAVDAYGDQWMRGLRTAVSTARQEDFEAIEPAPYATFEEIRIEGWLAWFRAEVCARACVAPELAMPARIMKDWKERLLQEDAELPSLLEGWRQTLLLPFAAEFATLQPPPRAEVPRTETAAT